MVKVAIDTSPLQKIMYNLRQGLPNAQGPLNKTRDWLMADIRKNFATEGALYGGWEQLKKRTQRERVKGGYGAAHPILVRTHVLKNGTRAKVTRNSLTIENNTPYFVYHQSSAPRTNMPRRIILNVRKEGVDAMVGFFIEWIVKMIKK